MEVPLVLILAHHSRLLKQEVRDLTAIRLAPSAELNLKIFALTNTKPVNNRRKQTVISPG